RHARANHGDADPPGRIHPGQDRPVLPDRTGRGGFDRAAGMPVVRGAVPRQSACPAAWNLALPAQHAGGGTADFNAMLDTATSLRVEFLFPNARVHAVGFRVSDFQHACGDAMADVYRSSPLLPGGIAGNLS